jgi:hypothetical protein
MQIQKEGHFCSTLTQFRNTSLLGFVHNRIIFPNFNRAI